MKRVYLVLVMCLASACSTVTITPKGQSKLSIPPTYEDRMPFFLGGLIGEKDVDVKAVCKGKTVKQVQTQQVFMDSFLAVVTLTIYAPRTVKIWCEKEGA
jgi:hypothetical protein